MSNQPATAATTPVNKFDIFKTVLGILDDDDMDLNPCCNSLRLVKLRSTGVRVPGLRILFNFAKHLEGVRCNSYDVLRALVSHLKMLRKFESFSTLEDTSIYIRRQGAFPNGPLARTCIFLWFEPETLLIL